MHHTEFRRHAQGILDQSLMIQIKVKLFSRAAKLTELDDGSYVADLTCPPVDGKANAELIALVAEHFNVPKSAVTIKSGATTRSKRILVKR
jgi:hypothetical protein